MVLIRKKPGVDTPGLIFTIKFSALKGYRIGLTFYVQKAYAVMGNLTRFPILQKHLKGA